MKGPLLATWTTRMILLLETLLLLPTVAAVAAKHGGGSYSIRSYLRNEERQARERRLASADFYWELTMEDGYPLFPHNLTDVRDYNDDMVLLYNYTGTLTQAKTLEASLLQYDCIQATDEIGVNISATDYGISGQMFVFTDIDTDSITNSVAHYQQDDVGSATISFCLRVDYVYTGPNAKLESVNFHETKVRISVDLLANFTLTAVDIQRFDPSSSELTQEVNAPVIAYFCDENYTDIGQPTFAQGDLVVGCMAVVPEQQHEYSVDYILELDFDSGNIHDDVIVNGIWDNFVDVKCCGGICQFKRILPSKYFSVPNPPPLKIAGGVILKYTPTVNMIPLMQQFYIDTDGPNWFIQGGWPRGCPCEWRGVTCNAAEYVTAIDLPNTGLSGPLPSGIANIWTIESLSFSGNSLTALPASLGELPLTTLILDDNQISFIPTEIGLLPLTNLDLTNNKLQSIPTQLGLLTDLTQLKIANNQINTPLPTELANLTSLSTVEMANNQIPGPLPAYLGSLTGLVTLEIRDNAFTGMVPENYGELSLLTSLTFTRNQLTSVPEGFFHNFVNLEYLDFSYNELVAIGEGIGALSENLREINLSHNNLTSLPKTMGNLASLEVLDVSYNKLGGTPITEIGQLASLRELYLGYNEMTGTIPRTWSNCVNLQSLSLRQNQIQDIFPNHLQVLLGLSYIDLAVNQLEGNLPSVMSGFDGLIFLDVSFNSFNGPINDWTLLPTLRELKASNNELTGTIPAHFANCPFLQLLHLDSNSLTGVVTPELAQVPFLHDLNLAYNQLTGSFPVDVTGAASLFSLDLSHNVGLAGELPTELGLMTNLRTLRVTGNNFAGPLHREMGNMRDLSTLDASENSFTGTIPTELGNASRMSSLLLDNNDLTGPLPTEMARMSELDVLDVSNNKLTGTVPSEYGAWSRLHELRLHGNSLSGSMPAEVCALRLQEFDDNGWGEETWDIVNDLTADCAEVACDCCTGCW